MINSIQLHNFKCYKNAEFNLKNLTVFCGNNSTGKSTAIQALAIILQSNSSNKLNLNGDLTSVGYLNDIKCAYCTDDEISISIETEAGNFAWGVNTEDNIATESQSTLNQQQQKPLPLHQITNSFQFLEAERYGPRDNHKLSQVPYHSYWLGSKGEYAIEVLEKLTNKESLALNSSDPRKHKEIKSSRLISNINGWMSEISPGFKIDANRNEHANVSYASISSNNEDSRKPINVGFGLSYVLSIVTALLITPSNGLVIIENPEAHLHPRGQSYIGRLIALATIAGVQVIIETHSEHIINGIRIIARLNADYQDNLFRIYYISKDQINHTKVDLLPIGIKGEIPSWPEGFFDQQSIDIKTLIKG